MTSYPVERVLQDLISAVKEDDKVAAFQAVLEPMMMPERTPRQEQARLLLALVIAMPGATIDGQRLGLIEFLQNLGIRDPNMASDRTIQRIIRPYGRKNLDPITEEGE